MHPNDPSLRSFVDVAKDSGFPIQNLPYGVFSTTSDSRPRVGVAIGDYVLDLAAVEEAGIIPRMSAQSVFRQPSLNALMASGGYSWSIARKHISWYTKGLVGAAHFRLLPLSDGMSAADPVVKASIRTVRVERWRYLPVLR